MADRLATFLCSRDVQGKLWPPGGGQVKKWVQPNGTNVVLVSHGDTFDLYIGRQQLYNLELTRRVAVSLGRWLVRWWIVSTWLGLRSWLWQGVQRRRMNAQLEKQNGS